MSVRAGEAKRWETSAKTLTRKGQIQDTLRKQNNLKILDAGEGKRNQRVWLKWMLVPFSSIRQKERGAVVGPQASPTYLVPEVTTIRGSVRGIKSAVFLKASR